MVGDRDLIQLFKPMPAVQRSYHSGAYWSVGMLSIATHLKRKGFRVQLFDGELFKDKEELAKLIDPKASLVGFSAETLNYRNVLWLAEKAKEKGVEAVAVGGPHASFLPREILENRPFVDFVVRHKGEIALEKLLKGASLETIPNLVFRKNNEVVFNDLQPLQPTLDEMVPFDYSFLSEQYFKNQEKLVAPWKHRTYVALSHEGCLHRCLNGGCVFCAIPTENYFRSPKVFWQEILQAREQLKVNVVKDFGDSIASKKEWLAELVRSRPKNLDVQFEVYARSPDLDKKTVELLKGLGVSLVYLGFESGDDRMLKALNKGATIKDHLNAARLLSRKNIGVVASFVFGAPGETTQTIQNTASFAKRLCEQVKIKGVCASPLVPHPGSPAFASLLRVCPEVQGADLLEPRELELKWLENFCPSLAKTPEKSLEVILGVANELGGFGEVFWRQSID